MTDTYVEHAPLQGHMMTWTDAVFAGVFTHAALNQLWQVSPDADPESPEQHGCCPLCCKPCAVIMQLTISGELNSWVLAYPVGLDGTRWWTSTGVDIDWLRRAWANADKLGCHDPDEISALYIQLNV